MAYSFEQVFAADPSNPANVARNAAVTIFAPGDIAQTPLTLTTPNGDPLANPLQVNNNGFGSAFMHATLDRVAWAGGNFTGFFTSYEGMKAEAVSARTAAQTAASTAGADAAADLAARIAAGEFVGAPGADGSNVLPTDTAIKNAITTPGTETATALSATIDTQVTAGVAPKLDKTEAAATYAKPIGNSVILFGTSLEAQNGVGSNNTDPTGGSYPSMNARGWFHWANAFTGDKLTLVRNAGVGGNTYAQMLARIDADVLAYDSAWVFIGGPVNDVIQGRTAAAIIADATTILDKLAGRRVLILTASATSDYATTAQKTVLSTVNAWITNLPRTRRNVTVANAWSVLADRATGAAGPGMTITGDVIHWSNAAAARVGKAAATAVVPHLASAPPKSSHNADPLSVIGNPQFLTNGTGWTLYGGTIAYTADAETFANKATLTVAANTQNDERNINYLENIAGGRFTVGDTVQATVRVKWSGLVPLGIAASNIPIVTIRQRLSGGAFSNGASGMTASSGSNVVPINMPTSGDIVLTTTRTTIQAGVDRLYIYLGWQGAADVVVEFSELSMLKVAP